jgi:hypothetical protein
MCLADNLAARTVSASMASFTDLRFRIPETLLPTDPTFPNPTETQTLGTVSRSSVRRCSAPWRCSGAEGRASTSNETLKSMSACRSNDHPRVPGTDALHPPYSSAQSIARPSPCLVLQGRPTTALPRVEAACSWAAKNKSALLCSWFKSRSRKVNAFGDSLQKLLAQIFEIPQAVLVGRRLTAAKIVETRFPHSVAEPRCEDWDIPILMRKASRIRLV